MRLINADKIIKKLKDRMSNPSTVFINTVLIELIKEEPTVDAEPVRHGHWIEKEIELDWCDDDVDIIYECSCCDERTPFTSNYCPNCGAKMDEVNE